MSDKLDNDQDNQDNQDNFDKKKYREFLQLSLLQQKVDMSKEASSTNNYSKLDVYDNEEVDSLKNNVDKLKKDLNDLVASMSSKQFKLYTALADGKSQERSMSEAGYTGGRNIIYNSKIQDALKIYRELSQTTTLLNNAKVILNKNSIIFILSDIIRNTKNDKLRLSSIALFSKVMGFESANKVEMTINDISKLSDAQLMKILEKDE